MPFAAPTPLRVPIDEPVLFAKMPTHRSTDRISHGASFALISRVFVEKQ